MKTLNAERRDEEGFWLIPCPKKREEFQRNKIIQLRVEVPDYQCIGSFVRGTETCKHLQSGSVGPEGAQMKCLWPEEIKDGHLAFTVGGN